MTDEPNTPLIANSDPITQAKLLAQRYGHRTYTPRRVTEVRTVEPGLLRIVFAPVPHPETTYTLTRDLHPTPGDVLLCTIPQPMAKQEADTNA
jgi:hypothetical protein